MAGVTQRQMDLEGLLSPDGTLRTTGLMGWVGPESGGAFGHHCLRCGVRFTTQVSMTGETGTEENLLACAVAFAETWHRCR